MVGIGRWYEVSVMLMWGSIRSFDLLDRELVPKAWKRYELGIEWKMCCEFGYGL